MKILWLLFYFAGLGLLAHWIGDALPRKRFRANRRPFCTAKWEREGRIYEKIGIKRWKDRMIDKSQFVPSEYTKKVDPNDGAGEIERLVQETCVAEAVHWALLILSLGVLLFTSGWYAAAGLFLGVLFNLPYIIIQRYNRPRLVKYLERLQRLARRKNRNVLILTCSTGEGHNSVAKALMEEYSAHGVSCEMKNALQFEVRGVSELISRGHAFLYRHAPKLYGAGYELFDIRSEKTGAHTHRVLIKKKRNRYRKLREYIIDHNFSTVLMPHVFPATAVTKMQPALPADIFTAFIATDYTCSPGVGKTKTSLCIIPHEDLEEEFRKKGIGGEIAALGLPVRAEFSGRTDRLEAREKLGLPPEGAIVLIMTGSMGVSAAYDIAKRLFDNLGDRINVVVLCGNNEKLMEKFREHCAGRSGVIPVGMTDQVSLYMDASDVFITKGGGLSSTEAAVKHIPLVHMDVVPGCETYNISFFAKRGLSIEGKDAADAALCAIRLLVSPEECRRMAEAQKKNIPSDAAARICRITMERHGTK